MRVSYGAVVKKAAALYFCDNGCDDKETEQDLIAGHSKMDGSERVNRMGQSRRKNEPEN